MGECGDTWCKLLFHSKIHLLLVFCFGIGGCYFYMENTLQKWFILHDCEAVEANTNFADGHFVSCIVFVVTSFLTPNFSC